MGKKGTKGQSNYEWIIRDTGFSVMQALPSTHDRNEYLLNEIPPPRSPSPGRTNAQPKCPLQHCTHSVRPAHKRPPSRQREMGHFAVQRQKQNQFIWAAHHLQNKTRVAETHKSVIQNYKVFPNLCTGQSTSMERAKVPISKADPN